MDASSGQPSGQLWRSYDRHVEGTSDRPEDASTSTRATRPISDGPRLRAITRVTSALVVLAVVAGVVVSAADEWHFARSAASQTEVTHGDLDAVYWSCLTTQVQRLVPPGQLVWVSSQAPNASSSLRSLWKATAGIRPISAQAYGAIDLYLVPATNGHGCLGTDVKAVYPTGIITNGSATVPAADWALWRASGSSQAP